MIYLKKKKMLFISYKKFNVKRIKIVLFINLLKNNYFYFFRFYGPLGFFDYKFYNNIYPLCENIFYFFSKKFLNSFVSFFKLSHRSLCLGYFCQLSFSGVGFKFWKSILNQKHNKLINNNIFFLLGFSHYFLVKLPKIIFIYFKKPRFCLFSFSKSVLSNYKVIIENLRFPDPYKLKGILLKDKVIIRKQGKQR